MENKFLKTFYFLYVNKKNWSVFSQQFEIIKEIKEIVKKEKVICALSGS